VFAGGKKQGRKHSGSTVEKSDQRCSIIEKRKDTLVCAEKGTFFQKGQTDKHPPDLLGRGWVFGERKLEEFCRE